MEKLFYLSLAILVFPVLRLKWMEVFRRLFSPFRKLWASLGIPRVKWNSWFKSGQRTTKGAKVFSEVFTKHFHPEEGLFNDDKDLRKRVYDTFIKTVKQANNYKSIYRKMAGAFHPNSAPHTRLLYDELELLFKYYQANFTHPDDLPGH